MKIREIRSAQDMKQLREDPSGSYRLMADIHMAGEDWLPLDFSGSLDGNGYAIRDLKVEKADDREYAGLFGILSGTVRNLHLRDVNVCANGAKYAGTVAGVIEGTAEGCTATGQICACTPVCAGALAGKVSGTCLGGTDLTAEAGPHEAGGLCADVAIQGNAALVGEIVPGATVTGLWRDNTHRTKWLSKTLRQRREKVVDYMRAMATVRWQIDQDKLEYIKNRKAPKCTHYQCYERGKTYMGIPYAHSAGGMARFLSVMASKHGDVYTAIPDLPNGEYYVGETAKALESEGISNKDNYGFTQYMGNDCSSAVSWSWRQVSSVDMAEGGCYGRYSGNMIPTEDNKKNHGILPVGDFFACSEDTRQVLADVGEQAIYEAYAGARMGDAIAGYDTSGHVLLLSFDPMVIRDAAGKIDPHKSFLVTIEQGGGFYDSKGTDNLFKENLPEPIQVSWRVDYRYYFHDLVHYDKYTDLAEKRKMIGCNHCYMPITMQALNVEKTPAATPRVWMQGATVHSNFYISATQLDGPPVHTQISHDWHIYRQFPVTAVDLAATHSLQPGTYTARIHLSNEQIETVTFTV